MIYHVLRKGVQQLLLILLTGYSCYFSRFFPSSCRFYPSCSHYSHDAIKKHGIVPGILLTISRLLRCHPWHEGGADPIPEQFRFHVLWSTKLTARGCHGKHEHLKTNTHTNT